MTQQSATVPRASLDPPRPFASGQDGDRVEILSIRGIESLPAFTPLPDAPAYVKGVMMLRGSVVPLVDLRKMLGVAGIEGGQLTVIAVVRLRGQPMGFLVDPARDALSLTGA